MSFSSFAILSEIIALPLDNYNLDIAEIEKQYNEYIQEQEELLDEIETKGYYTESKITWQEEIEQINTELQKDITNEQKNALLAEKARLELLWENRVEYDAVLDEIDSLNKELKSEKNSLTSTYNLDILLIEANIDGLENSLNIKNTGN